MCGLNITCNDFGFVRDCRRTCESGCFCNDGSVLEDGICVHPDVCPSKEVWYCISLLSGRNYVMVVLLLNNIGRLDFAIGLPMKIGYSGMLFW